MICESELGVQPSQQAESRPPRRHLRTEEVADRLGVKVKTVRDWRNKTRRLKELHGPPFITISKRLVVYDEDEFNAWLKSKAAQSG